MFLYIRAREYPCLHECKSTCVSNLCWHLCILWFFSPCISRQGLLLNLELFDGAGLLSQLLWGPFCLCFKSTGLQAAFTHTWLPQLLCFSLNLDSPDPRGYSCTSSALPCVVCPALILLLQPFLYQREYREKQVVWISGRYDAYILNSLL